MSTIAIKYSTIVDTIGHTPLVQLLHINPYPLATILVKLEFMNPAGSIKDRMVLHIINDAEQKGLLKPGGDHHREHLREHWRCSRHDRRYQRL